MIRLRGPLLMIDATETNGAKHSADLRPEMKVLGRTSHLPGAFIQWRIAGAG
jgi:hypothetical protein